MEQFNLERALAGEALVTRDGREVTNFGTDSEGDYCASVAGMNILVSYHSTGAHYFDNKDLDLFMVKSVTAKVEPVLIPFDLQRALKGDKLITRDGRAATGFKTRRLETSTTDYPYSASVEGDDFPRTYTAAGHHDLVEEKGKADLFMAEAADNKLKVGDWLQCTKYYQFEHNINVEFTTGLWYRIGLLDDKCTHVELGDGTVFTFPNTGLAAHFDLTNVQPYMTVAAPAPSTLKAGDWIQCVKTMRAPYSQVAFAKDGWFEVAKTGNGYVHLLLQGAECLIPHENVSTFFEVFNPRPYNPQSKNLLQEANDLIYGQRESDYGSVTTNFNNIAQGWSVILGVTVTPTQVGLAMAWLKTCREVNKSQRDNILDIAGYMGCLDKLSRGE